MSLALPPDLIADDDVLLRRIYPGSWARDRPGSGSFKPKRGEPLSVHVERRLIAMGASAETTLIGRPLFGLVSFRARLARECDLEVEWDPDGEDALGQAHAVLIGRFSEPTLRRLATECVHLVVPALPSDLAPQA